ncbi:hypothetical protein GTO91_02805 [Heliobacterium undosum]|uniref:Uncharacterized protein n=1 Tax=Heliomicrobium undosum TaxID=121734 RepID=A0A845L130_9FIRM|nr:hypothetical protein [Heliomicrobium undosum]MZP28649.1 hypothetical protein [Heliomicrobium undosum]
MGTAVSWVLLILPWFLLIPLNMKRVKRFLSVAFFTTIVDTILFQTAEVLNWWNVSSNVAFLTSVSSFTYGFLPVTTIIVFYFTYPNVWLFFGVNFVIDALQAFIISPYVFMKVGLYQLNSMSNLGLFFLLIGHLPIIFLYQRWYDEFAGEVSYLPKLKLAIAKRLTSNKK